MDSIQRKGRPLQRTLALELQNEAKVPLGPCSYDALTQFSQAPVPHRLPDHPGGCTAIVPHHDVWTPF